MKRLVVGPVKVCKTIVLFYPRDTRNLIMHICDLHDYAYAHLYMPSLAFGSRTHSHPALKFTQAILSSRMSRVASPHMLASRQDAF